MESENTVCSSALEACVGAITFCRFVAAYGENSWRIMSENHARAFENLCQKLQENVKKSTENRAESHQNSKQMLQNSMFYPKILPETSK